MVLRDEGAERLFGGFYLMANWFLTPDSRVYDDSAAAYASLEPTRLLSKRTEAAARGRLVQDRQSTR